MMPGMPDLTQIVLKAQQMQAEMERAQASLAQTEVTGSAGGGLVTAVVAGGGELRSIRIDPSVVDPADVETLEDLVVAAVHDARRAAEALATSTMGTVAGGLADSLDLSSLGLPGMSFPGFGGSPSELKDDDEDDDSDYDSDYDDDDSDYDDSDDSDDDSDYDDDDSDDEDEIVEIDAPDPLPGQGQLPPGGLGGSPSGRGEA
jgi:DNA-binding YbaB/EbfC family protein